MKCEQVAEQISAWIDGELTSTQRRNVESHVNECAACGALSEALHAVHEETREEFSNADAATQRVVERTINQLPLQNGVSARTPRADWFWYASLIAAAAAGFAMAILFVPGGDSSTANLQDPPPAGTPFAAVQLTTGPFEVASHLDPVVFVEHTSPILEVGAKLRTEHAKTELQTTSGTIIRLDAQTEISALSVDEIVLKSGRIWCGTASRSSKFAVSISGAKVHVDQATCDIKTSAQGAEVIALYGDLQVEGPDWQSTIGAGNKARLADGRLFDLGGVANLTIETRWIHDLLLQREPDNIELQERVEKLWASLGYSKVRYLYEEELRSMGVSCVNPLSSFLASKDSTHQQDRRRALAAEIVADVADFYTASKLIDLLNDEDPQVRYHIARGLHRISGRDMGMPTDQWKTASPEQRATAVQAWRTWLSDRNLQQKI